MNGVVDDINQLSPALADRYAVLMEHQIFLINQAVRGIRDSACRFAAILAIQPKFTRPLTIWACDRQVTKQGELIYDPPSVTGLIADIISEIAERESRDIVNNIQVPDRIASTPAPIRTVL